MLMMYVTLLGLFLVSLVGTGVLNIIFRFFGRRGLMGNLYQNIRGGTPRAIGLIPFIILSLYLPQGYNSMVLIIGITAFLDDILGRKKIYYSNLEWGQLFRGIGMLLVMIVGFPLMGPASILVALLVQPVNISDMQPGTTCSLVLLLTLVIMFLMIILRIPTITNLPSFYVPLLTFIVCLGYAPLDYLGKIMLGEVGNHSFAVALGISFYMLGGIWTTILFFIILAILIALMRARTLYEFLTMKLKIYNPTFGDYVMDVLTGGGLGDLIRKILFNHKQIQVKNPILIMLGFRRLLYNPYAPNNQQHFSNTVSENSSDLRKFI